MEEATNQTSIELARTAESHCRAFLVQSGYEMIEKSCETLSPEVARVLRNIYQLYAYDEALKALGDLLRVSYRRLHGWKDSRSIHLHLFSLCPPVYDDLGE